MESLPETIESGEETEQVSSADDPPQEEFSALDGLSAPQTNEEFETRVTKLMEMMDADPEVRDRVLAEIYVNIASAEQGIRGVFEMIQTQGVGGFMRGAFKRG